MFRTLSKMVSAVAGPQRGSKLKNRDKLTDVLMARKDVHARGISNSFNCAQRVGGSASGPSASFREILSKRVQGHP